MVEAAMLSYIIGCMLLVVCCCPRREVEERTNDHREDLLPTAEIVIDPSLANLPVANVVYEEVSIQAP